MSERWTYRQEKIGILLMMYDYRAGKVGTGQVLIHPYEDISWAYGEGEGVVRIGLNLIIGNIVHLIISTAAGYPNPESELEVAGHTRIRGEIQSVLDETPLDQLLADIPEDEARDIRYDLELLGFIPPVMSKPWLNLSN